MALRNSSKLYFISFYLVAKLTVVLTIYSTYCETKYEIWFWKNSGSCESMQHLGDVRLTSFVPGSNAKRSYFPSLPLSWRVKRFLPWFAPWFWWEKNRIWQDDESESRKSRPQPPSRPNVRRRLIIEEKLPCHVVHNRHTLLPRSQVLVENFDFWIQM